MKCLRKILQERKILLPPILTDRHDGMTVIINKNECGSNAAVTVGNVPSDQLALADKPFGCGVIIVI